MDMAWFPLMVTASRDMAGLAPRRLIIWEGAILGNEYEVFKGNLENCPRASLYSTRPEIEGCYGLPGFLN